MVKNMATIATRAFIIVKCMIKIAETTDGKLLMRKWPTYN